MYEIEEIKEYSMKKNNQLVFYIAELNQCNYILQNNEIKNQISLFLLKYVTLEAFYKKLLVAEKEKSGKKLSQKDKKNLRVTSSEVKRVLDYFEIDCDINLIERIFGSNDKNYTECSIKKLRDRMVHTVNDNVLRVILERYEQMDKDMDAFENLFISQSGR